MQLQDFAAQAAKACSKANLADISKAYPGTWPYRRRLLVSNGHMCGKQSCVQILRQRLCVVKKPETVCVVNNHVCRC